jgi:hypothetical protein
MLSATGHGVIRLRVRGARPRLAGVTEQTGTFLLSVPSLHQEHSLKGTQAMKPKELLFLTEPFPRDDTVPILPHADAMDIGIAQLARKLNDTLHVHLPKELPAHLQHGDEKALAVFGAENCIRRINLRHPEDTLGGTEFVQVLKDLLEELYWALPQTESPPYTRWG